MYFELNSDNSSYEWNMKDSINSSLYGELFIEISGNKFPFEGWIDIVSSVLDMWIDSLIKVIQSITNDEKEFHFMDGPYYFTVSNIKNEMVFITLYKKDRKVNEEPYEISFYNLYSEITKVLKEISMDKRFSEMIRINRLIKKYKNLKQIAKNKGYKI